MIDPVSIGIAFTAAQQAISGIKQAVAMGKDITSLYNQFSRFFEHSDKIHIEHNKIKAGISELTDGQIRSMSLQIAMQSKALRDAEKELKDMLVWSGNKDVWEEMQRERIKMIKERTTREDNLKKARAKAKLDLLDRLIIFVSVSIFVLPAYGIALYMLSK